MTDRTRRLAAVWFADIVGYTDLSSRDEEAALAVVSRLQELARTEVEAHGGRVVKFVGDAVLAAFDSADAAVRAAVTLQESFSASRLVHETDSALRVGVHLGEVIEAEDGDIYGDGVNVASRIEGQAQAGQVVVSEDVHRALRQQAEHVFKPFGPVRLRGVEEPMWLYVVGGGEVIAHVHRSAEESTPTYALITRHWPKLAVGGLGLAVVVGLVLPDLILGASFQSYAFSWAITTGGVWFLFDKAEAAMSARSRKAIVGWLRGDHRRYLESIPDQFVTLFDRVFGPRHFTVSCLLRSTVATIISVSIAAALLVALVLIPFFSEGPTNELAAVADFTIQMAVVAFATVVVTVLPDYLSLLETRWVLGRTAATGGLVGALVVDLFLTLVIAGAVFVPLELYALDQPLFPTLDLTLVGILGVPSTFFTSAWLWLYAASVLLSRLMLRLNSGVGFLLRVTDVERQPFRSMGFVSVIIMSLIFALGLPLVLL